MTLLVVRSLNGVCTRVQSLVQASVSSLAVVRRSFRRTARIAKLAQHAITCT